MNWLTSNDLHPERHGDATPLRVHARLLDLLTELYPNARPKSPVARGRAQPSSQRRSDASDASGPRAVRHHSRNFKHPPSTYAFPFPPTTPSALRQRPH
ncbi:hypothetical protein ACFSC4_17445 [Deinococcus malanensis]|uniref:hypothetical protein n=1 Tax=Deinococcus malanensis TaxID=1706855 RepID=UPI003634DB0E